MSTKANRWRDLLSLTNLLDGFVENSGSLKTKGLAVAFSQCSFVFMGLSKMKKSSLPQSCQP
jgi:hypothetical protein